LGTFPGEDRAAGWKCDKAQKEAAERVETCAQKKAKNWKELHGIEGTSCSMIREHVQKILGGRTRAAVRKPTGAGSHILTPRGPKRSKKREKKAGNHEREMEEKAMKDSSYSVRRERPHQGGFRNEGK